MNTFIDWVNDNAGFLNLVFAFVVAASAVFTSFFNCQLTKETVTLRKAETDPDIAIYLAPGEGNVGIFYLVIRNIGRGAAYRVSFNVEPHEHRTQKSYIREVAVLRDGIQYLAPDQELWTFTGKYPDLESDPVDIAATYYGKHRGPSSPFIEKFLIDVRQFAGVRPPHPLVEKQAKAVQQIADDIRQIRVGHSPIRFELCESEIRSNRSGTLSWLRSTARWLQRIAKEQSTGGGS